MRLPCTRAALRKRSRISRSPSSASSNNGRRLCGEMDFVRGTAELESAGVRTKPGRIYGRRFRGRKLCREMGFVRGTAELE